MAFTKRKTYIRDDSVVMVEVRRNLFIEVSIAEMQELLR